MVKAAGVAVSVALLVPAAALSLPAASAAGSLEPSSALLVSLAVVSAYARCVAVAWGCMAFAVIVMGIVALTMDVHAIA